MSATKVCAGCKLEKVAEEFKLAPGGLYYENCNKCFVANNVLFGKTKISKSVDNAKTRSPLKTIEETAMDAPTQTARSATPKPSSCNIDKSMSWAQRKLSGMNLTIDIPTYTHIDM